jgi:hypothetical protein
MEDPTMTLLGKMVLVVLAIMMITALSALEANAQAPCANLQNQH